MGIKNYVSTLLTKYPKTHTPVLPGHVDYFFFDFNSIIYNVMDKMKLKYKDMMPKTGDEFEDLLIREVIETTRVMITETIQPKKLAYIAMDGTAPRAKIVRGRWRRYKEELNTEYLNALKKTYGQEITPSLWDRGNITPGTSFMLGLAKEMQRVVQAGHYSTHAPNCTIVISDATVPGEGEHKYLPMIKKMRDDKESHVTVFSPDADVVVLSMLTNKNRITVLQPTRSYTDETMRTLYANKDYVCINVDEIKKSMIESFHIKDIVDIGFLAQPGSGPSTGFQQKPDLSKRVRLSEERIMNDYITLLSLAGNDFIFPMPYLEVKDKGDDMLMRIYQQLLPHFQNHLLLWDPESPTVRPQLNIPFLEAIFIELSKSEDYLMRKHQEGYRRNLANQQRNADQHVPLRDPAEEYAYHVDLFNRGLLVKQNPLYKEYGTDWQLIDCTQPKAVWKAQYYKALFDLDPMNVKEYNEMRQQISVHYLQSLMFSTIYYFDGLPSWRWYYPYYAPPCISDVVFALRRFSQMNSIPFVQGLPYKPLEQLMLVTSPRQATSILPKKLAVGMQSLDSPILSYFPTTYRANMVFATKWERTEVLFVPDPNDSLVLSWMETIYPKLAKKDAQRNELNETPFIYRGKKGEGMAVNHLSSMSQSKVPVMDLSQGMGPIGQLPKVLGPKRK